ncbi:Fc.00g009110.m01.CDS01 [Cosmosporella sp. VM-42]
MTTLINTSESVPAPPRPLRFVHNQGQPPSKRRRINSACLTCRRRKTRCAGERPLCSTCTKNGHECLGYPEEIKKEGGENPGPESRVDGDNYDAHDVRDTRDAHDYGEREDEGNHKPTIQVKTTPEIRRVSPKVILPTPAKVMIEHAEDVEAPRSTYTNHSLPLLGPSRNIQSHDLPSSPTAVRRLESHRVPYFRYFGPTAICPGFKQMVVSVRDRRRSTGATTGSLAATSPLSANSGGVGSSCAADSDIIHQDLPVYDPSDSAPVHPLILDLCNTFFLQMGSSYPFLKKPRFLRMVKEKAVEPMLVDSVCALAARFSDSQFLTGGNDKMPRNERGAVFAQRARQATVDTFPCPTVSAVQACLLMAYEGFGAGQDSALWMYLGLAIRMAVDLGIQKEVGVQYQGERDPWYLRNLKRKTDEDTPEEKPVHPNGLSPEEQKEVVQERMDTFWAVFILDRVISSGTGRPVTFRDEDFELSIPESYVDPATRWPAPFPVFLQIIHLYGRVSDVLNNIRNMQDLTQDKWDRLREMEHQLTKMYKNWDCRLQFNVSNFKAYLGIGQGTTFILLHFWFHALFIILHQPTLLTPFGEHGNELQLLSDSRELSVSSAKTICDILSFADLIDPKSFIGNPFTNQPIYIAACAFLMESSANASEGPSRASSPQGSKPSITKPRDSKSSRHSLLASAANQNYQRCYNSLQQINSYWFGVNYILTALDQKAKGIWDCETYTIEEYESTKSTRRESRGAMANQFARFDNPATPKVTGPPIAWSLAGTANSPSSSLTLLYQNLDTVAVQNSQTSRPLPHPNTPPGNMVYDPIRQSLPESGTMYPPAYPQSNASAVRQSSRPPMARRSSNRSNASGPGRQTVMFDTLPEGAEGMELYMASRVPTGQPPNGYEGYSVSPSSTMPENGTANPARIGANGANMTNNFYYPQGAPYQISWGPPMGNLDAITFDSQDIDIGALGLQQDALLGPWLDYIPEEMLGLFGNPDMDQGNPDINQGGQ